jgi:FkbM family methyltransferase
MAIIFDVGANNGNSCIHFAHDPNNTVYAFEPTPELVEIIKSKTSHLPNYKLFQCAVSNYMGKSIFNVAANEDWGCSSLLEFSDNLEYRWPNRVLNCTHKIEVNVIKLEFIMKLYDITVIDHFHCDAQGSDLNVLKGLGPHIKKIKSGVIECALINDVLYKNQNSFQDCKNFLEENNFIITDLLSDPYGNEVNIVFKSKNEI